jgi:DNA repair photolyase
MAIQTIAAKSILQKSGIPGVDAVVNPYVGCVHACAYCYARFMKRFTGHDEPWGTFLDAKMNAAQVLARQLDRRREPFHGTVFFSSVTDPYQPPERRFRLTRQCLEVLLERRIPVSILTKSDLVLRDLDLLKRFPSAVVGLSFSTLDEELAGFLEPHASSPSNRIRALRTLRENGIRTWAFLSPYLPMVSNLDAMLEALERAVDEIGVESINMIGGNWTGVEKVLKKHRPDLLESCRTLSRDNAYWLGLEAQTEQLVKRYRTDFMGFFRH